MTFSSAITNVTKTTAGDRNTTWWRTGATGINLSAGGVAYPTSPISLVSITRS
ncbi:hypothetical protein [Cryobacterium sp. GrIS_2_6]|uniref:hypothetical protein n=1 Tax=Cryobacterium sp. GrIS_2_6 TaxID=3162785 RepID=UPI002E048A7D|nr:hypothetical protein [Cryobacterium psychrotolerans]